jgi:hypothetical protein
MPSVAGTLLLCCGNHTKHIHRLRGWQNVGFCNAKFGGEVKVKVKETP